MYMYREKPSILIVDFAPTSLFRTTLSLSRLPHRYQVTKTSIATVIRSDPRATQRFRQNTHPDTTEHIPYNTHVAYSIAYNNPTSTVPITNPDRFPPPFFDRSCPYHMRKGSIALSDLRVSSPEANPKSPSTVKHKKPLWGSPTYP